MKKQTNWKIALIINLLVVLTGYIVVIYRADGLALDWSGFVDGLAENRSLLPPVLVLMLLFGIYYAIHIAIEPFRPGLTWLSVVIGDAVTDGGSFCIIYLLTGSIGLASVPVISHLLTGVPMIVSQATKHIVQPDGVIVIEEED